MIPCTVANDNNIKAISNQVFIKINNSKASHNSHQPFKVRIESPFRDYILPHFLLLSIVVTLQNKVKQHEEYDMGGNHHKAEILSEKGVGRHLGRAPLLEPVGDSAPGGLLEQNKRETDEQKKLLKEQLDQELDTLAKNIGMLDKPKPKQGFLGRIFKK